MINFNYLSTTNSLHFDESVALAELAPQRPPPTCSSHLNLRLGGVRRPHEHHHLVALLSLTRLQVDIHNRVPVHWIDCLKTAVNW